MTAIADWLDAVSADARFAEPWVSGLTVVADSGAPVVQFTMDVDVTNLNLVQRDVATAVGA
jgi:hypothetical protein